MLRGFIKDITGLSSEIHMRTDANNLVTIASTTHVPEQQETIHMIQMLRKEACSGCIAGLSHIRTQWCLADCLTKKSANPQNLIDAVHILLSDHCWNTRPTSGHGCPQFAVMLIFDMMFFCWVIP